MEVIDNLAGAVVSALDMDWSIRNSHGFTAALIGYMRTHHEDFRLCAHIFLHFPTVYGIIHVSYTDEVPYG